MVCEIAGGDVRIIPDVVRTSGRDVLTVLSVVRKGTDIDRRILDIIVAGVELAFGSVSVLENLRHINGSVGTEIQSVLAGRQGRHGRHRENKYAEFFHNIQIYFMNHFH